MRSSSAENLRTNLTNFTSTCGCRKQPVSTAEPPANISKDVFDTWYYQNRLKKEDETALPLERTLIRAKHGSIRIDIDNIRVEDLSQDFKKEYCHYVHAVGTRRLGTTTNYVAGLENNLRLIGENLISISFLTFLLPKDRMQHDRVEACSCKP